MMSPQNTGVLGKQQHINTGKLHYRQIKGYPFYITKNLDSYIFLTLVPWALRISATIPVVKTTGPTPYSSEIIVHSVCKMSQTLGLNQGQFCCPGDIWQRKPGNILEGFPGGSLVKYPPANEGDTGDVGSIPGSGKSPGGGNGNPLQYSCLENPKDRGAWWTTVRGITELDTTQHTRGDRCLLSQLHVCRGVSATVTYWLEARCCSVTQLCLTLCDPMDCNMPGMLPNTLQGKGQAHNQGIPAPRCQQGAG